ncbi:MAG: hypothetical protein LIQ31_16410, partial [Planctomycetes bacterium]|nr:hypothetical protein [Planctomycetota bacterium]
MYKSKVTLSKLLVALAITVVCVLELMNSPLQKRIIRLEKQISAVEKYDTNQADLPNFRANLEDARRLYADVQADPRRWPERLPVNLGLDLRGG